MRVATWESSAGALAAFLNSTTQTYMVDLFTFTLSGGAVIRYTSADVPVTVNGDTYLTGPALKRGKTKLTVGISVDSLNLIVMADSSVTINSVPILQFIAGGGLDGAKFSLQRAFAADPLSTWVGVLGLFQGRVSNVTASRYEASINVKSDSELLNVMIPRNVYQPGCSNSLFDSACGLVKSAYLVSATATGGTNPAKTMFSTGLGQATGYFSQGFVVCTAGANAGLSRTVKNFASGVITTIQPWAAPVTAGDTFSIYPGCDKTQATCASKFNNVIKFRGHPYVPAPETVT